MAWWPVLAAAPLPCLLSALGEGEGAMSPSGGGGGGGGTVQSRGKGCMQTCARVCLSSRWSSCLATHSPSAPADLLLPAYMPEGDRKGTQALSPGTPRGLHCLRDTMLQSYSLRVGTAHTHPNTHVPLPTPLNSGIPVHT